MSGGQSGGNVSRRLTAGRLIATAAAVLAMSATVAPIDRLAAKSTHAPDIKASAPGFRRLSEVQYARAIEQTFGSGLKVPGRFDPPLREQGLLAIGDAHVTVSASGIEQYELRAREVAAQVMAEGRASLPCKSITAGTFDEACARAFFARYGRQLYRRPLSEQELSSIVALSSSGTQLGHSFSKGLEVGLARLLMSPNFIFRVERPQVDASAPGGQRLDDYSLATRISFLLWDAPPDEALLDAVARGDMRNAARLKRQVDRMIASPKFEQGVRAFFSDMFGYEQFRGLAKDQAIYPKFSSQLAIDAQEQTLRTIVDLLVTNRGDYRDLFTTRKTFMNRTLGAVYKVPVSTEGFEGWAPFTFPGDAPRAGILSLAGFLMLDPTHEGKSSPTIRGKTVRELLLCQPVPAPPPNVSFNIVQDDSNPLYKTARDRLLAHQENPACSGCHALTDPIGLSLENYDAIGSYRTHEKTALIDASGTFDGKPYLGLGGLSKLLHDSPDIPGCVVQRAFEYGVGRAAAGSDAAWLEYAISQFVADRYQFPELMRRIAMSNALAATAVDTPANAVNSARTHYSFRSNAR